MCTGYAKLSLGMKKYANVVQTSQNHIKNTNLTTSKKPKLNQTTLHYLIH